MGVALDPVGRGCRMNHPDAMIEVRNLNVRFGSREVLRDVSFSVDKGEFVAIVGRSGCGKSTMLNALADFIDRKGYIRIPDNIGFIFQSYAVFPWLTVEGNIRFGMRSQKGPFDSAKMGSLLQMTELADVAAKYPAELSGGQVQRVAVARALARSPEVLLMDEPFGALDAYTREKMQGWLLKLCEDNKHTIVFVTHSIEEAILLSERILVMTQGRILKTVQIPFTRPRAKAIQYEPEFVELTREISNLLEENSSE